MSDFRDVFADAVREGLCNLLGATSGTFILDYLEKGTSFDIFRDPERFAEALENFFGAQTTYVLDKGILAVLYKKLGLRFEEKKGYLFRDYVLEVKARTLSREKVKRGFRPISGGDKLDRK